MRERETEADESVRTQRDLTVVSTLIAFFLIIARCKPPGALSMALQLPSKLPGQDWISNSPELMNERERRRKRSRESLPSVLCPIVCGGRSAFSEEESDYFGVSEGEVAITDRQEDRHGTHTH